MGTAGTAAMFVRENPHRRRSPKRTKTRVGQEFQRCWLQPSHLTDPRQRGASANICACPRCQMIARGWKVEGCVITVSDHGTLALPQPCGCCPINDHLSDHLNDRSDCTVPGWMTCVTRSHSGSSEGVWLKPLIRDTSCCCHRLTGAPRLRPGPGRTTHSLGTSTSTSGPPPPPGCIRLYIDNPQH